VILESISAKHTTPNTDPDEEVTSMYDGVTAGGGDFIVAAVGAKSAPAADTISATLSEWAITVAARPKSDG
jgi:hypothetical protein